MTPSHLKASLIVSLCFLFIVNTCNAVMCARLKGVSGGEGHTLALADDNTLWACGNGALGLGSSVYSVSSLQQVKDENGVDYLKNIVAFDAGWTHSLAADVNGTLWAWGGNGYGQLGIGPGNDTSFPTKVHGPNDVGYLGNIVYVSAGRTGTHSLAVDSSGYVYAWGHNNSGQCGNGSYDNQYIPVLVLSDDPQSGLHLGDIAHIIQVDAGVTHSIALDSDGYVWHWGSDSSTGTYPEKVKASDVFGGQELSNIAQIATGALSVAVDRNGNVWEWGDSHSAYKVPGGQMGTTYLENIAEVSTGGLYSLGRTRDGYVLQWYIGRASPWYVPAGDMDTQSGLLEGINSIGVGYGDYQLAVDKNGYGWGWGANAAGQLGVGDQRDHSEPTQMLCADVSNSIYLTKTAQIQGSEPNCVHPFNGNNYLVYTICYGNPITSPSDPNYYGSVSGVSIVDYLPAEVNFYSASGGGVYDANAGTVKWTIGTLAPGNSGCFTLTTTANKYAQPGGQISNFVKIAANKYYSTATITVSVCYWDGRIIYVDHKANGYHNGTNWNDAYTDFNEALVEAAGLGNCEIWVAGGTYKQTYNYPDTYSGATFRIPAGNIAIRGHFGGVGVYETSPDHRDFNNAAYETILDGRVASESERASYTVTCDNIGAGLLLDGLTFTGASDKGLYINDYSDPSIVRCKFTGNAQYGIYADNDSYPDINDCEFFENGNFGIYSSHSAWPYIKNSIFDGNNNNSYGLYGTYSEMTVEDCVIRRQNKDGTNLSNSHITLNHCEIEDNGADGINGSNSSLEITDCNLENNGSSGIYCSNSSLEATKCNIAGNGSDGIWAESSSIEVARCTMQGNGNNGLRAQSASFPTIANNIIYNNLDNGIYTRDVENALIKSNWIYRNGSGDTDAGLYFKDSISPPVVRNNTIVGNAPYGIYVYYGRDPCLTNDIIYDNGTGPGKNIYSERGLSHVSASYCCIGGGFTGTGNISCDPCFKNTDANDYRLSDDSNCIDAGNSLLSYAGETDIDGRPRVIYGKVDIGASEWHFGPDYNFDGFINFIDFAVLAKYWKQTNAVDISLDDDNDVDIGDLAVFAENWLWNVWQSEFDYNNDDTVDFRDFAVLARTWDKNIDTLVKFCDDWLRE